MRARRYTCVALLALLLAGVAVVPAGAADVINNGHFTTDISGWTLGTDPNGTTAHDATWGGAAPGSLSFQSNTGRNLTYDNSATQSLGTIDPGTDVWVSLTWIKDSDVAVARRHELHVILVRPDLSEAILWSDVSEPAPGSPTSGTMAPVNAVSSLTTSGAYSIKIQHVSQNDRNTNYARSRVDDVVVDIAAGNAAPTVSASATAASPASILRSGTNTTTLSATFDDADSPGVGAFNVTFSVREPDNSTTVAIATAAVNGAQGVTIVDNGGGSYTASVDWDPGDGQAVGAYDLYFEVSDGTDNAVDGYAANPDELTLTNQAPSVSAGNTSASPASIQAVGAFSTTLSATFTDLDQPGISAFTVSFVVREPDNSTPVNIATNAANGAQGVTIVDNGGGSYTASVSWDPGDSQALGSYDLYFEVSDGTDNAVDGYAANPDELTLTNQAPSVSAGNTSASPASIQAVGAATTTLSATFTDLDQPGISAFTVSFVVREPDNSTPVNIATNAANGAQGVSIVDNGGGSYTASVSWDPGDAQTVGLYDLQFEVSDGVDTATDPFTSNLDELTLTDPVPNEPPVVNAGATTASPTTIFRAGASSTTLSATFSDADVPGIGAFSVGFSVREPDDATVVGVVSGSGNGANGVTIVDNGGGSYTARVDWDPGDTQAVGAYDLYFEVSDGADSGVDAYANNLDELTLLNRSPTLVTGVAYALPTSVNRLTAETTNLSATFSDADQPGVSGFTVTFKVREPDDATEISIATAAGDGVQGVTIIDNGGGSYTANVDWDPGDTQTLGTYDLYFEVSDGEDAAIDDYVNNLDELTVIEVIVNNPPVIAVGAPSINPPSVDRVGSGTVDISVDFSDPDGPGVGAFTVDFTLRQPYASGFYYPAIGLQNGQGGLTITDLGGNSYRATITWDPPDDAPLGYYDLEARVSDGEEFAVDSYDNNPDELLLTNGGENVAPIVQHDETSASPAGIPRVGPTTTTLGATFLDQDVPGIGAFTVTFKVREPDDSTEIAIATDAPHGTAGVTISDLGGGVYHASVDWDPADAQAAGFYDLHFSVSDGVASAVDEFINNADELELYDDIANQTPTTVAGNTSVSPTTITRFGSEYTMLRAEFSDPDQPGFSTFVVTFSVRDPSSSETVVVNAATHGSQGLRVRYLGGDLYDASVLWDPPVGQVTGTYDLSFTVQDAGGLSATDAYGNNADELTITATGVAGDGNLLRRSHTAEGCGGPASGCHNILDHQGQDCLVCHTPHGSSNIYLVRETISTPTSGDKPVLFKTTGIGDPDNDPDPVIGDPNSGAPADDSDGVFTGVCEVCHTATKYHRNDGTQPETGHRNAEDCAGCHAHGEGFPAPEGDPESSGGQSCSCHSAIGGGMTISDSAYHHLLTDMSADYSVSAKTCLMCHVDHDIFRPDVNTGIGTRAANLRVDITTPVVTGDASVLANSDYLTTGAGGICLACHVTAQTKGYTQPDGTTETIVINKSDFDAATSSHNYSVPTTFTADSSTFNANCVKCHDDQTSTSYQEAGQSFATHTAPYRRMLNSFGTVSPTDPLEENHCFGCHSTSSNPNAGSNQDYFAAKTMSNTALALETVVGYAYAHPITSFSGRHKPDETAADLADGSTRHVECGDCHNVHAARAGNHDSSSNLVSNPLKGVWGVEPIFGTLPTPTDNGNVFSAVTGYTRMEPAVSEYQICLKCHSDYTTLPAGSPNIAEEIDPRYPSTHGIMSPGTNDFCNSTTMNEPWGTSKTAWCSDCHRSNVSTDPGGPHGSNVEHLLVATIVSDDVNGTPLCMVCHKSTVYWDGDASPSRYSQHPATKGAHQLAYGCFMCHMWDYSSTPGLGANSVDDLSAGRLFVHGMNKRHVYNERTGGAGINPAQGQDAFVGGYIADMDYANQECWSEVCKTHAGQGY